MVTYLVVFIPCEHVPREEYYYSSLDDALYHFHCFSSDDSHLYQCVYVMEWNTHKEKLIQLRSFASHRKVNPLGRKDEQIEKIKHMFPGMKIVLRYIGDVSIMNSGMQGIITKVDDQYQIHIHWDNNSILPVIIGIDDFMLYQN